LPPTRALYTVSELMLFPQRPTMPPAPMIINSNVPRPPPPPIHAQVAAVTSELVVKAPPPTSTIPESPLSAMTPDRWLADTAPSEPAAELEPAAPKVTTAQALLNKRIEDAENDGGSDDVDMTDIAWPELLMERTFSYMSEEQLARHREVLKRRKEEVPVTYRPVAGEVRKQVLKKHPLPPRQPEGVLNRPQWIWKKDVQHVLNIAAILHENDGECRYHECIKGLTDGNKPELIELVSKFCNHFDWTDAGKTRLHLCTNLGKLTRMMRKVTAIEENASINSSLNNVKRTDEGAGQYAELPIFQKGANSDNQQPVWKTRQCMHWADMNRGCGVSDKCTYFHQGYDYYNEQESNGMRRGFVMASEEAMSYNLENKDVDKDTWMKIKASITRAWCVANKRDAGDKWKGQQLTELWVTLTDDEASKRTEDSFKSTPKLSWNESGPPTQPPPPPQPVHDDRKHGRDWDGSDKAHAKYARHEKSGGPWSAWDPQHAAWKGDSTWEKEAEPPYSQKWKTWEKDEPQRHDEPQRDWHHSPHKGAPSTYWKAAEDDEPWKAADIKKALANSLETMAAEMAKVNDLRNRLG